MLTKLNNAQKCCRRTLTSQWFVKADKPKKRLKLNVISSLWQSKSWRWAVKMLIQSQFQATQPVRLQKNKFRKINLHCRSCRRFHPKSIHKCAHQICRWKSFLCWKKNWTKTSAEWVRNLGFSVKILPSLGITTIFPTSLNRTTEDSYCAAKTDFLRKNNSIPIRTVNSTFHTF